jgi:hypothetical protein
MMKRLMLRRIASMLYCLIALLLHRFIASSLYCSSLLLLSFAGDPMKPSCSRVSREVSIGCPMILKSAR